MPLVVKSSFTKDGKTFSPGTVLFDAEAEAVASNPIFAKHTVRVHESHVGHLRPGWMIEAVVKTDGSVRRIGA